MDPITHGLIGAAISTLSGNPIELTNPFFLGATIGAMAPDLDIVTHLKGRLNYLLNHRGPSHSLLALGGMAVGISTVIYGFFPETAWNSIFFWTLMGTLSHGLSDLLNSYGAELFWPFSRKKITVNMAMLTEPVIFLLFLCSVLFSYYFPMYAKESTIMAFLSSTFYLSYRELGRRKVRITLMEIYHLKDKNQIKVMPAMYKPFSWNFLLLQKNFVRFGTVRRNVPEIQRVLPRWDEEDPYIASALDGALAEVFERFTPYYHLTLNRNDDELIVDFMDLRYWSKRDFLYTGRIIMNEEGEIAKETFYHSPKREGILLGY